jgi:hypothetical protein
LKPQLGLIRFHRFFQSLVAVEVTRLSEHPFAIGARR